jgi:hypothetical protein
MLCASRQFIHVPEPLSVLNRQTILPSRVEHWYTYIADENEDLYLSFYRQALAFQSHPIHDIKRMRLGSPRDPVRIPKRWASFLLGRVQRRRLLVRDPFAVFSIEWFWRRLNCEIVVIVRHPVAAISSLKRLGFTFDFGNLLQQPLLMEQRLQRFRPEMEAMLRSPEDVIGHGSLLWRIVYDAVSADQRVVPSMRVVRHEDLSRDPINEYSRLYEALGVPFDERARRTIAKSTNDRNPTEVSRADPFRLRLDSRANLSNWSHRLHPDEVERIVEATWDVAARYYPGERTPVTGP